MNIKTELKCNLIDLSDRYISTNCRIQCKTSKIKQNSGKVNARISDELTKQHSMSWFRKDELNDVLEDLMCHQKYYKVLLLIFGCNTGYRCGDILSLRVGDLLNNKGTIKQYITLQEQKTNKWRTVWFNETVRKMITFVVSYYGLTKDNYIFRSGERKKCFVESVFTDENGREIIKTTGEMYDWNGRKLEIAPFTVKGVNGFIQGIFKKHNFVGRYGSHSMRQTHIQYISYGKNEIDLMYGSMSVGHSNLKITEQHYNGLDNRVLQERMLNLNIGKEIIDKYI